MIISQTTTIVFEYPQDYLQEQEWLKEKAEQWVHIGTDTQCAIYEYQCSYRVGADMRNGDIDCHNCIHDGEPWYSESCDSCSKAESNFEERRE